MYSTPTSRLPIWDASRMRWASPPESESADRPRVRYSSPTFLRNRRRSFTSFRIGRAMPGSSPPAPRPLPRSGTLSKNASASLTGSSTTSPMLFPCTSTERLSGLSRLPPHVGHGCSSMNSPSCSRTLAGAQPGAIRTRAERRVEGELTRLELGQRQPALGAGVALREQRRARAPRPLRRHLHRAVGGLERRLDRVRQARAVRLADHEAIDHYGDVVVLAAIQLWYLGQIVRLTVHPHPHEA